MAFVRHVSSVLLRGQTTDQLINALKYTNVQRLCLFSSFTRSDSQLFQEIRKPTCAVPHVNTLPLVKFFHSRRVQPRRWNRFKRQRQRGDSIENGDTPAPPCGFKFNPALVEELLSKMDGDMPITSMPDPFEKDYPRCFICRYNIEVDHKNIRLLSQFVSPYTGRIYGRAITGLCIPMQRRISQLIIRARKCGFMQIGAKDAKYLQDQLPYDAMSRQKH